LIKLTRLKWGQRLKYNPEILKKRHSNYPGGPRTHLDLTVYMRVTPALPMKSVKFNYSPDNQMARSMKTERERAIRLCGK